MTATPDPTALDRFVYSQQPGYDEITTRTAFAGAVPLKTIVIYCYDPRAAAIPAELAKLWPDETYPGGLILDEHGHKVGSTATIFPIVVAGGRATDVLRSITIGHHLFGLQNVVVVHHTNCGTSSFTPQGLFDAYRTEQGSDLSDICDSDSLAIGHLETSLHYDVDLLRTSAAVPATARIFGMVFDIASNEFTVLIPHDRIGALDGRTVVDSVTTRPTAQTTRYCTGGLSRFERSCLDRLERGVLVSSTCESPPGRSSVPSPGAVSAGDRCGPAGARCWGVRRRRRSGWLR